MFSSVPFLVVMGGFMIFLYSSKNLQARLVYIDADMIVTNLWSLKIFSQVPRRNSRAFTPSSAQKPRKNFYIAGNSVK